jgi:hypothetical protein
MGIKGVHLDKADTIAELLSTKADRRDVQALNDLKATRQETEGLMQLLTTLN